MQVAPLVPAPVPPHSNSITSAPIVSSVSEFGFPDVVVPSPNKFQPPNWEGKPSALYAFRRVTARNFQDLGWETFSRGFILFGRDLAVVHAFVGHPTVSGQQAVAIWDRRDGRCFIKDLESAHGTHVNDEVISNTKYTPLQPGCRIRFGNSSQLFVFERLPNAPTDVPPSLSQPPPPPPNASNEDLAHRTPPAPVPRSPGSSRRSPGSSRRSPGGRSPSTRTPRSPRNRRRLPGSPRSPGGRPRDPRERFNDRRPPPEYQDRRHTQDRDRDFNDRRLKPDNYDDRRNRGGPPDDRTRFRGGPPDDRERFRGGPAADRDRFRAGPPDDRDRFRGGPPNDRDRFRGGPPDDRNRFRGGQPDDRDKFRGPPPGDRRREGPPDDRFNRRNSYERARSPRRSRDGFH